MAKRAPAPATPPFIPGWQDADGGADWLDAPGHVAVKVRPVTTADPRRDTWEWSTASRNGRHVGDLDSAKARALDQHQRHG